MLDHDYCILGGASVGRDLLPIQRSTQAHFSGRYLPMNGSLMART